MTKQVLFDDFFFSICDPICRDEAYGLEQATKQDRRGPLRGPASRVHITMDRLPRPPARACHACLLAADRSRRQNARSSWRRICDECSEIYLTQPLLVPIERVRFCPDTLGAWGQSREIYQAWDTGRGAVVPARKYRLPMLEGKVAVVFQDAANAETVDLLLGPLAVKPDRPFVLRYCSSIKSFCASDCFGTSKDKSCLAHIKQRAKRGGELNGFEQCWAGDAKRKRVNPVDELADAGWTRSQQSYSGNPTVYVQAAKDDITGMMWPVVRPIANPQHAVPGVPHGVGFTSTGFHTAPASGAVPKVGLQLREGHHECCGSQRTLGHAPGCFFDGKHANPLLHGKMSAPLGPDARQRAKTNRPAHNYGTILKESATGMSTQVRPFPETAPSAVSSLETDNVRLHDAHLLTADAAAPLPYRQPSWGQWPMPPQPQVPLMPQPQQMLLMPTRPSMSLLPMPAQLPLMPGPPQISMVPMQTHPRAAGTRSQHRSRVLAIP